MKTIKLKVQNIKLNNNTIVLCYLKNSSQTFKFKLKLKQESDINCNYSLIQRYLTLLN